MLPLLLLLMLARNCIIWQINDLVNIQIDMLYQNLKINDIIKYVGFISLPSATVNENLCSCSFRKNYIS